LFKTSGASRFIIDPVSSHSPFSRTQLICFLMNLSSFNICPDTNFFASHFALSTPSLTLSRKPFWGLRFGLGRTGLGRPRLGGDCLGKGLLGGVSVGGGSPGVATLVTCRDSAGG